VAEALHVRAQLHRPPISGGIKGQGDRQAGSACAVALDYKPGLQASAPRARPLIPSFSRCSRSKAGFTTVQAGPVIKIVPSRVVRESAALTTSREPGDARTSTILARGAAGLGVAML